MEKDCLRVTCATPLCAVTRSIRAVPEVARLYRQGLLTWRCTRCAPRIYHLDIPCG